MPDTCPICKTDIIFTRMNIPPVVIKAPVLSEDILSSAEPAFLIKPSSGKSFLKDYANGDSLHCGLRDELGIVYTFVCFFICPCFI